MSARREAALRVLLVSGSLLAVFLAAEVALRLLRYGPERYPAMARLYDKGWTTLLDCYPDNPRGYFDLDLRRPESRERFRGLAPNRYDGIAARAPYAVEFHYNAQRFRDRPLDAKTAGVARVMVVGDSFTEGQGVKEADTAVRLLESRLASHGAVEVRNCARRGKDFPELYEAFADAIPSGADVVVYAMVLNDGARSPEFQARQTYVNDWILERGQMEFHDAVRPWWTRSRVAALVADRVEARKIDAESTRWYRDMYTDANAAGWHDTQAFIRRMDERTRAQGGRFMVALWPLLVDLGDRYPFAETHEIVRRFCEAAGIPFLDLRPALAGQPASALWVHPLDRHPNEVAQRLAADALTPMVSSLLSPAAAAPAQK
jgi:GDSL-like Lipase/Acylhydrolase family